MSPFWRLAIEPLAHRAARRRSRAGRWGAALFLPALLLGLAAPVRAFTPTTVTIAPNPLDIPCGGSKAVTVTVTGTLTAGDLLVGNVPVRLVDEDTLSDDLLDDANWPVPGAFAAGAVVTFALTFTLTCTADCVLQGAKGSSGEASAELAAEFTEFGSNFGSATANCVKKKTKTASSSTACPDQVTIGEPLSFVAIAFAGTNSKIRKAKGQVLVTLSQLGGNGGVVAQTAFNNLKQPVVLDGFIPTNGLPSGHYRLGVFVKNKADRLLSEQFHDVELVN